MSQYPESKRVCSMFSNASKSGGTYYSGKIGGSDPVTIEPGQRVTMVKSKKLTANGDEIWSLLVDPAGADDQKRVLDQRSDLDLGDHRGREQATPRRTFDDEIPF